MDRKSSKYLGKDTNKCSDASVTSQLWNFPSFSLRDMMKAQEREKERGKLSVPTQLWIGSVEVSQSVKEIQELVKHKPYGLREIIKDSEYDKAVLAFVDRNTWYNTYPKFKCAIEQSTPEIKQKNLKF